MSLSNIPISNYPIDLLRIIFELIEDYSTPQGFKAATILSHVSQYWRYVAFNIPSLWVYIRFSLLDLDGSARSLVESAIQKVKITPVILVITHIHWSFNPSFQGYGLDRLPHIERLELRTQGYGPVRWEFIGGVFKASNSGIKTLQLTAAISAPKWTWECASLVDQFPSLSRLALNGCGSCQFSSSPRKDTLRFLKVQNMLIEFADVIIHFELLEELVLESAAFGGVNGLNPHAMVAKRLKKLDVTKVQLGTWLNQLSCPMLTELICDNISRNDNNVGITFISLNRSITTLVCREGLCTDERVNSAAPQLQHLTVTHVEQEFWRPWPGDPPLFTSLRTLTVREFPANSFEDLVRGRCLPKTSHESRLIDGVRPLESLFVVVTSSELASDPFWKRSKLYELGQKEVTKDDRNGRFLYSFPRAVKPKSDYKEHGSYHVVSTRLTWVFHN